MFVTYDIWYKVVMQVILEMFKSFNESRVEINWHLYIYFRYAIMNAHSFRELYSVVSWRSENIEYKSLKLTYLLTWTQIIRT